MAKKILTGILVCIMLFPLSVLFFPEEGAVQQHDREKAEAYFNRLPVSKTPHTKGDGTKYRIAYVDIDPYPASGEMLYYFIEQLRENGWISYAGELPFQPENTDAQKLIRYLSEKNLGKYIQFLDEANYYIAVDDREACMKSLQNQIDRKEVDLIFCMGTSPGEMVIKEMQVKDVPVMVYFSVDPVGAGLAADEEYSGQDNVWCHTSSEVYSNQIQFYYKSCPFQNIGVVYYSRTVAAMGAYCKAAEETGFCITEKKVETLSNAADRKQVEEYYQMLSKVFSGLVNEEKIDAFLLGTDIIKDEARIEELLSVFYEKKIPVFVQNGEYYVKDGAFMAVTASDAKIQAPFAAEAMAAILNGESAGKVYQKFVPSPYLSINLDVAEKIGYEVKEELLLSAEKLYSKAGLDGR